MLPHRPTSPYKSNSVSRVGSYSRMNYLSQGNNTSTPAQTPTYVTSSLNPIKNLPTTSNNVKSKIRTKEELEKFEKLPIVECINHYEQLLDELSNDITSFKSQSIYDKTEKIISNNQKLMEWLDDLNHHKSLSIKNDKYSERNKGLETMSKDMLKELVKYRNELKSLPRLPHEHDSVPDLDIDEILRYAMKLAKFTKAPVAIGNLQYQLHPNNFIWPAEDSLRKGMLALASLKADKIIKHELQGDAENDVAHEIDQVDQELNENASPDQHESSWKSESKINHKVPQQAPQQPVQPENLNLDLFDPEDEYSD